MEDEVHDGGLLGGGGAAPGPDPLDAVRAVAEPRQEARAASGREEEEGRNGGLVVETRIRVEGEGTAETASAGGGDQGEPGEREGKEDDYGEFAWPDGYAADPEAVAMFVPLAKKLGLPKESAQELAGLYAELEQRKHQTQAEFVARNNAEWLREIQGHPEFGGPGLARTSESVAASLRRYGSPLLMAQIRQMNIQNWPEMFYFLARVARAVSEDCSPPSAGGAAAPKSTAQLLFPGLK